MKHCKHNVCWRENSLLWQHHQLGNITFPLVHIRVGSTRFLEISILVLSVSQWQKAEANCDPNANAWCAYIDSMTMDIPKWNINNLSS